MSNEVFELTDGHTSKAVIRVVGVGGGGCNTVNQMAQAGIAGVDFICANTDRDQLERMVTPNQIQLGSGITRGLGAGSNPAVGRQAAEEDRDRIREILEGTDLLFITAGMGGGTGTGAAPVVAEIAREMKILTVAVVTKPFPHEGAKRMQMANEGIKLLEESVDSLILIPNEKLRMVLGGQMSLKDCFKAANDVLQNAVQGITDLIYRPGEINVDFADVRTVMGNRGLAMMGVGTASGEDRAQRAIEAALSSPLLDDLELTGAHGVLVNITCDDSLRLEEWEIIAERIKDFACEDADAKIGTAYDPSLSGELRVTLVATGLNSARKNVVPIKADIRANRRAPAAGSGFGLGNAGATGTLGAGPAGHGAHVHPVAAPQPFAPMQPHGFVQGRNTLGAAAAAATAAPAMLDYNEDYLDIPTFLREQAD